MRILYLHQYFNTLEMAGGTRSFEMARRLVAKGHEVHVVTSRRDGQTDAAACEESVEAGIRVSWLRVPYSNAMGYGDRMMAFADFALRCSITAMRERPDVVLATSTPLTIAFPGVAASRWHRVPMVFEVRDLWPEAAIQMGALRSRTLIAGAQWLERTAYRHSAEVIALSPGMRDGIVATGIDPDRVTMIPNSADIDLFSPAIDGSELRQQLGLSGRVLAYFGSMGPMHGVGFIVDAAAEFQRRGATDVTFLLCGDGKERPALESRVRAEGLTNVRFLGPLPKREVAGVAAAADVCLATMANLPVIYTSSPNKLFDSLAAGRPVVTNMPGWQRQIVESNQCGVFVEPGNAIDFTDRVSELLASPQRMADFGRNARHAAETLFARDVLADQLEQVLVRAVDRSRSTQPRVAPRAVGAVGGARATVSSGGTAYRRYGKRAFDIVAALIGIVLLAPVLLVVAAVVGLRLGRPFFFRQDRPGRDGIIFRILKFRTMGDARDMSGRWLPDGERLTRVGSLLRALSLDELPELLNVLKGDMSVVGPRPLLVQYVDRYSPEQARRHDVRPGITGLAQVSGRNAISWERKFELDVEYVDHCSLTLDLKILAQTVGSVLARKGISQAGQATVAEFMGTPSR